jgi:hypothetical protein
MLDCRHVGDRVVAREEHDRGAGEDRQDQPEILPRDPEHWREVEDDCIRPDAHAERAGRRCGVDHVTLRVDAAFRQSGGAAGVVERRHVVEAGIQTGKFADRRF